MRNLLNIHSRERSYKSHQCDFKSVHSNDLQAMRLCICSGRQFEKTFENSHWRKVLQMQLMRLCICSGRQFEKTSENSHWGKVLQMQLTFVKTRKWISFPNPTFPMPKRFKYSQATNICGNHVVNAISKN